MVAKRQLTDSLLGIMETLRLWPVVPNGTFRQLSYEDEVKGPGGKMVKLPKGTLVQVS